MVSFVQHFYERAFDSRWSVLEAARFRPEEPIGEKTDRQVCTMHYIKQRLKSAADRWIRNQAFTPVYHAGWEYQRGERFWSAMAYDPAPSILPILEQYYSKEPGEGKVAIDLGCGNSQTVSFLLKRGWTVIAVDNLPLALSLLTDKNPEAVASGQLQVVEADISTYRPDSPADLVIASDILPFIDPEKFMGIWKRIHDLCVKEKGFIAGNLFCALSGFGNDSLMYALQNMGAWVLPDKRMVQPLLTHAGYESKTCEFRHDIPGHQDHSMQFVAQKITAPAQK